MEQASAPANKLLLVILAVLLPPLAVALKTGLDKTFVLNLILTLFMWIPGLIHALIVIL
ncbi:YqaE/Pmp3 family membrane protein [Luteolibacter marinus]|uniref:YqaE/Pmp3 family membrane protein n=1 Tax=Luteolibacter marinus TaxID=2776705 RepID=UPI001868E4F3|nr:YqaE/Pmp3 family membrane protein [Luteolibacter marinus]